VEAGPVANDRFAARGRRTCVIGTATTRIARTGIRRLAGVVAATSANSRIGSALIEWSQPGSNR